MSEYIHIPFSVVDYAGNNTLSAYSLEQTPLTFIPNLNNAGSNRVFWEFGDGTVSESLTSVKYYNRPGNYVVKLTVFDCYSNAQLSIENKTVTIVDLFDHSFNIEFEDEDLYDSIMWENGKIHGPIKIKTFYPHYIPPSSIFYEISGSDSINEFSIDDRYSHLKRTNSLFEKLYNYTSKTYQYNEILSIDIPKHYKIFYRVKNGNLEQCDEFDDGAFFVALSGEKDVFFKDDSVSGEVIINLFFDKKQTPEYIKSKDHNNISSSITLSVIENDEVERISITSNGIDGEGFPISSFNIDQTKFSNTEISFALKIKDEENFTVKNFTLSSIDQFNVSVLSSGSPIDDSFYIIKPIEIYDGAILGNITFNVDNLVENVELSSYLYIENDHGSSYEIGGKSSSFNVYPINYYKLEKKHEDFDMTEAYKGLRFQEFLLDKSVLFDDFIGSIFNDSGVSDESLGSKVHEKITNFVENTQDVDRNEIFALLSHMQMLDVRTNQFESTRFNFPVSIKRLIDLASIQKNKLIGTNNKFSENFNIRGASKELFGKNLGDEIDTNTYMVSANVGIVALEKFSGNYILLNTFQPVVSAQFTYPLSSYSEDWGWPLVLPDNFSTEDLYKYYTFFEYVSSYDGSVTNNTLINIELLNDVDFDYVLTNKIKDTLYQTLSLVK